MRHVLGVGGVAAAAVLLIVSAAMNWRFGYTLGKSEFESQLYGAASAAADCFKALLPFFIFAAMRNKMYSQVMGGVLLFVVCFTYSFTSSLGFAALNRIDTNGFKALKAETHQDLRVELNQSRDALKALGTYRPIGTVRSELEATKQNPLWLQTQQCAQATLPKSFSYCESYFKLQSQIAISEQADKLETRISTARTKLGETTVEAVAEAKDPQAQFLASLVGLTPEQVTLALTVLIALLVELGASLGFYTAFAYWRVFDVKGLPAEQPAVSSVPYAPYTLAARSMPHAPVRQPALDDMIPEPELHLSEAEPKTDVELYFDDRVGRESGTSVTALALYDDYCQWCEAKAKQPLGLPIFTRKFSDLGVTKAKVGGRIRYMDVRLLYSGEDDGMRELSAVS